MNYVDMIFPCCGKKLPAPLDMVETAICSCGQSYKPQVIIDYNELLYLVRSWATIIDGKALIKCEPGEESFVADICRRGGRFL